MTEAEWLGATDPQAMIGYLGYRAASHGGRKLRLFACACVREAIFAPDRYDCETAVEVAERLSEGQATVEEVEEAQRNTERGFALAVNAWSYLVGATAATLQPVPVEAAGLTVDNLETFNLELTSDNNASGCVRLLRDIFGNPFRPVALDPAWRTEAVVALAAGIYADRAFDRLPVLADALEDAGCGDADMLSHCRGPGPHVRGCWVVDLLLGKS